MRKGLNRIKNETVHIAHLIGRFVKRRYKSILYYAAMTLVLALVASVAERYRTDGEKEQSALLREKPVQETISEVEANVVYPETMRLIRGFDAQPAWNEALGQWETHTANDYVFADDRVICLADGFVKDVGESSLSGGYIEIEDGSGEVYRYLSVTPLQDVSVGDEVRAGEIIAEADDGMASELTLGKHLHLEIVEEETWNDFEQICGKNVTDAD